MNEGDTLEIDGVRFTPNGDFVLIRDGKDATVLLPKAALAHFVDLARSPAAMARIKKTIWGEKG